MNSLRRRLTRELLAALAGLLVAGLSVVTAAGWAELLDAFDGGLRARALAVSALTEFGNGRIQFDFSGDFVRGFGGQRSRHAFEVWDASGRALARSPSLAPAQDLPRDPAPRGRMKFRNLTLPDGRPGRLVTFAFEVKPDEDHPPPPGTVLPWAQVAVASDRSELNATLGAIVAAALGCAGLLLLAVGLIVPRVLRRGLAPLDDLAAKAVRIDAHSLTERFSAEGLPAELVPIADRLNELLSRLELSFERERRFSADLAHELRTPLAELRSLAECALKWPESRDPASDQEVLAVAAQMETLVARMLALARGERGQMAADLQTIDPAAAAADAWEPFAERARASGLQVEFLCAAGQARADPALLRSVLSNLFDNAVDHSPPGSGLRIRGQAAGSGYVLRLSNPAPGLEAQDVGRLFDRFWRKEAARAGGGEHVGLGLSLARSFAQAMGWTLEAALDGDGWIVFTLASKP